MLRDDAGQVLLVHGVCDVQRRARATNTAGQTYSFPLHLPVSVQRPTANAGQSQRMKPANWLDSALHPSRVAKSSTSFGWGKGGNVSSAGWQNKTAQK